jgi:hypothetical protein
MIERAPRMILSTEGLTSVGKTYFALKGVPRPVLLLDFDWGAEGLPADVLEGVDIAQFDTMEGAFLGESDARVQQLVKAEMARFLADYRKAITGGHYRTVVVDTCSTAWQGQRIARKDDTYAVAEEEFLGLIRAAYKSSVNLTLIHHLTTQWARSAEGKPYKKVGVYERIGMDNVDNRVQLAVRQSWVAPNAALGVMGHFEATVLKCRDRKELEGETIADPSWQLLCSLAVPGIDWEK